MIVEFYKTLDGTKPAGIFIKTIEDKKLKAKVIRSVKLMEQFGRNLGEPDSKHLEDGIWELRPGNRRVLYFFFRDDTFVLLHQFLKKTQKTPQKELDVAVKRYKKLCKG